MLSLTAVREDVPVVTDPIALLLADKRSPATRRAYEGDLRDFFGGTPAPAQVTEFLSLSVPAVALRLNSYKATMLAKGAAEATVNRRLAAVRSLLKFSHRIGLASTDGHGLVDGEKVRAYRNTRGVDIETLRKLIAAPGTGTLRGLRDTALLRLLCENALRRAEVCAVQASDFSRSEKRLLILGKGRGTQREAITLSTGTTDAIAAYLDAAGHTDGALFRNVDRRPGHKGDPLTVDGLYHVIGNYGAQAGVPNLTPHKLRHSAITAALDATKGDVRRVQKLSRHKDLRTLVAYDDARADHQGEVTELLSELLDAPE